MINSHYMVGYCLFVGAFLKKWIGSEVRESEALRKKFHSFCLIFFLCMRV